jgi:hypothetical protein
MCGTLSGLPACAVLPAEASRVQLPMFPPDRDDARRHPVLFRVVYRVLAKERDRVLHLSRGARGGGELNSGHAPEFTALVQRSGWPTLARLSPYGPTK